MNKKLAEKVKQLILEHHEHFDMRDWTNGYFVVTDQEALSRGCGTTGCLAAWICIAAGLEIYSNEWVNGEPKMHVEHKARQLLGLHNTDAFYSCRWPDPAFDEYMDAAKIGDTLTMAKAACKVLDHFGGLDD